MTAVLKCIQTCSQIYSLDEFSLPDKLCFSFFFNVIYVAEFLFRLQFTLIRAIFLHRNFSLAPIQSNGCVAGQREKFPGKPSLPADVLWGSFVTHSFLPHGRLLNTADIYVLDCLNKPVSGQLLCHDQPITRCDISVKAPTNYFSLFQRNIYPMPMHG